MKNFIIRRVCSLGTTFLVILFVSSIATAQIRVTSYTMANLNSIPKILFGEENKMYSVSSVNQLIEVYQTEPTFRTIYTVSLDPLSSIVDCVIENNKACLVLSQSSADFTSAKPRVIILDLTTESLLWDTVYDFTIPQYTSTTPQNVISGLDGNFYISIMSYNDTLTGPLAHIKVNSITGNMELQYCTAVYSQEFYLVCVKDDEYIYLSDGSKVIKVNSAGVVSSREVQPFQILKGYLRMPLENKGLLYVNATDAFTGNALVFEIGTDSIKTLPLRFNEDKVMNIVCSKDGTFFLLGQDSVGNLKISQQNKDGIRILDTVIQKYDSATMLACPVFENPEGGLLVVPLLQHMTNFKRTVYFIEIARTPFIPHILIGSDSASVVWNTPLNGGSPIKHYVVEYRKKSDNIWKRENVTTNTFSIAPLLQGEQYEVRVSAVNFVGTSAFSETVSLLSQSVGLKDNTLLSWSVFPNPISPSNKINVEGNGEVLYLYDLFGKKITEGKQINAPQQSGMYILQSEGYVPIKIIVE